LNKISFIHLFIHFNKYLLHNVANLKLKMKMKEGSWFLHVRVLEFGAFDRSNSQQTISTHVYDDRLIKSKPSILPSRPHGLNIGCELLSALYVSRLPSLYFYFTFSPLLLCIPFLSAPVVFIIIVGSLLAQA
jgi:hypothetical protein